MAVEVQAFRATFRPRQDQLPLVVGVLFEWEVLPIVLAQAVYTPSLLSEVGDPVQSDQILDLALDQPHQTGSVSAEVQASQESFHPIQEAGQEMEGEEAESEKVSPAGGISGVYLQTFPVVATLGPGLASVAHLVEERTFP